MRARYIGTRASPERADNQSLMLGGDYVVLALTARQGSVQLLVLTDDIRKPAWFPASEFDLVSDEVPTNWRIRLGLGGASGSVELGPKEWLEPGFFEDYWGDGGPATVAAQAVFERELEVILRES